MEVGERKEIVELSKKLCDANEVVVKYQEELHRVAKGCKVGNINKEYKAMMAPVEKLCDRLSSRSESRENAVKFITELFERVFRGARTMGGSERSMISFQEDGEKITLSIHPRGFSRMRRYSSRGNRLYTMEDIIWMKERKDKILGNLYEKKFDNLRTALEKFLDAVPEHMPDVREHEFKLEGKYVVSDSKTFKTVFFPNKVEIGSCSITLEADAPESKKHYYGSEDSLHFYEISEVNEAVAFVQAKEELQRYVDEYVRRLKSMGKELEMSVERLTNEFQRVLLVEAL